MKIVIIRHGKVNYTWSKRCTSAEFDKECTEYDQAKIFDEAYDIPEFDYMNIYVSLLSRSRETAMKCLGEKNMISTELINEVPLRSSFDTSMKLPLWFWNISGRVQWFANNSRQRESRLSTKTRARAFIDLLRKNNVDSIVFTHGFYMHTLLKEMNKAGFSTDRSHINYQTGEYIIVER